jgi:hypothetical protein
LVRLEDLLGEVVPVSDEGPVRVYSIGVIARLEECLVLAVDASCIPIEHIADLILGDQQIHLSL